MSDAIPSAGSESREGNPSGDAAAATYRSSDGTAVVIPSTPPSDGSEPRSDTATAPDSGADDRESEAVDDRLTAEQTREQLLASRRNEKRLQRELDRFQKAEKARADAEKTELERVTERAETAERELATMRRNELAKDAAREAGIPNLWHRLSGNDVRSLKADALRVREELQALGLIQTPPGMEGGVRSLGAPPQPARMDELIRGRAGQR